MGIWSFEKFPELRAERDLCRCRPLPGRFPETPRAGLIIYNKERCRLGNFPALQIYLDIY